MAIGESNDGRDKPKEKIIERNVSQGFNNNMAPEPSYTVVVSENPTAILPGFVDLNGTFLKRNLEEGRDRTGANGDDTNNGREIGGLEKVMAILEIPKDRFVALLKKGNLLIFKEDIKLSNFVESDHATELTNEETEHGTGISNVDADNNNNTTPGTSYQPAINQEPNWNLQREETNDSQAKDAFYLDNWGPPCYNSAGWN